MPSSPIGLLEADLPTIVLILMAEGLPFLLIGSLFSGLIEVFVGPEDVQRMMPRGTLLAVLMGVLWGFALPVGESGAVPVVRQLLRKGAPISWGVAFLLAAPAVNPVMLAGISAGYGWGRTLFLRAAIGLAVAVVMGFLFSLADPTDDLLRPTALATAEDHPERAVVPLGGRIRRALRIALRDFLDLGRYLAIGALVAALVQTFILRSVRLAADAAPLRAVVSAQVLASLLSAGSLGDAWLVLNLTGGAALAYLTFGTVVDLKTVVMWLSTFKVRTVAYLIALPLLMTLLASLIALFYLSE